MPQSKKAIQVPVNVKLEIANQHKVLSNLAGDMQETMSGFDPASALYKNAVKSFSKIASKLNFSEALLGKDFFSEADLNRVVKEMGMVSDLMTEINFKIQNTKSFKTLGIDTTELDNARESLSALRKEISKQNNKSVGSLMGTGKGQVSSSFLGELQGLSSKSGFKADKSYAANITTMTSKLEQQKATYQSLQNEIDKATQEAEEYLNVTGRLANDISGVKLKGTNADIAAAMSKMIRSHTVGEDGNWVAGGKTYAQVTSRWLGLGQIDFNKSAQEIADAIEQAINAAFSEKGGRTGNALVQNSRKYSTGTDAEKQAVEDLIQEDSSLALKQVEELKKNATAHDQLTSSIEAQITTLKQLREAYEGEIKRLNQGSVDAAQQRVDNAIAAANKQAEEQHNNAKDANKTVGGAQENVNKTYDANAERQRLANLQKEEANRRAQEAENFKENLKQSVRHWMSAQQIINIVKDGIRQAVQDIKGLDSAMSNIAVVTDMSISDLWGKINDYMAIAQRYGVTTQGVYEVSQLYYQQGLATAEVMELTTETLKLARVANMDYKDSADAMTVALRGFKMEMSEAATVTDVYSKVAAVTASDQAELAIAMSKTASSAASVGSSFENTTAMLAVMVETTRESAQNLGSALKSIISRYGEMKSGLTQDSEGEIIDYNKVDTALRSVGISIKDAQGQFRDFDDVIFELSEAWGGLDKNTQRYIATIMAGNRQQSRFIALVDNYERLKEVQAAADNSEDAGLLQYAKTLDSLETKMNNIKTSFQQFYMSIFNGEDFKNILDIINNVIKSLNRVGPLLGSLNVLNLINQIKMVGQLLINSFSNGLSKIQKSRQEWQDAFTGGWESAGDKIGQKIANGISGRLNEAIAGVKASIDNLNVVPTKAAHALSLGEGEDRGAKTMAYVSAMQQYESLATQIENNPNATAAEQSFASTIREAARIFHDQTIEGGKKTALEMIDGAEKAHNKAIQSAEEEGQQEKKDAVEEGRIEKQNAQKNTPSTWQEFTDGMLKNKKLQTAGKWAYGIGTIAQTAGMMINQDTMGGYDASTIVQGVGGAATAVSQFITGNFVGAAISAFTTIATTWTRISEREKVKLENLEKASEKANIERAEKNNRAQELSEALSNLKKLQAARNENQEAEQAFIEASNAAAEKFPELVSYYDKTGNAIVDTVTNAVDQEWLLIDARRQAAKATSDAAAAELKAAQEDEEQKEKDYQSYNNFGVDDNNWAAKELTLALEGKETWDEYSRRQNELASRNLPAWKLNDKEVTNEDAYYSALIDENSIFLQTLRNSVGQNDAEIINNLLQAAYDLETEEDKNNTINAITEYLRGKGLVEDTGTVYDYLGEISSAESAWKTSQIRSEAGRKAVLNSGIEDYFTLYDPRIGQEQGYKWRQFENFENYFYDMALSGLNYDENDFQDGKLKDTQQAEFTTKLNDLSQAFNEWYLKGISESEQQIFNDIMSNPTHYSSEELQSELGKLGIGKGLLNDEIMSLWASETVGEYERLMKAFELTIFTRKDGESDQDYLARLERQLYMQSFHNPVAQLISHDLEAAQQYLEFQQECQDIIDGKGAGSEAAQNRMDTVLTILNEIADGQDKGTIFGIDESAFGPDALNELKALLTASNAGTYEWGYQIAEIIKQATGEDAFGLIKPMLYENINTRAESVLAYVDETNKAIEDLAQKQSEGFSVSEARAFAGKIGKKFEEVFKITKDGKLVLINYEQDVQDYYLYELRNLQSLSETLGHYADQLNASSTREISEIEAKTLFSNSPELLAEYEKLQQQYGIVTEKMLFNAIQALGAGISEAQQLTDYEFKQSITDQALNDYIQSNGKDFAATYEGLVESLGIQFGENILTAEEFFESQLGEIIDFDSGKILDFQGLKEKYLEKGKWEEYGDSIIQAYLGQIENTLTGTAELLNLIESEGITLNDLQSKYDIDITNFADTMAMLPSAYAEYIANFAMDAVQKAQLLSDYRSGLLDATTGLLQGTGTWEEATRLQAMAGTGKKLQFHETSEGIQLMNESLGALLLTLKEDNSPLYAETYAEITKNIQEYYPELENVYDIQEKILELEKDKTVENEEQVRLLKAAANYASNTAGSKGFDFMSNSLAGNAENYLTYIENIGNAQNILKEFGSSGKIGAGDFMRMMQFAEDNGQKIPGWDKIYAAVNTADSDGNISKQALVDVFGDNPLQAIAQLMKDSDFEFRQDQYNIQADRTRTAQILSGEAGGIDESKWNEVISGDAPLTVRIDGEAATAEDENRILTEWANLASAERDEILATGVWEISTDTTGIIQDAANSLTSIEERVGLLADYVISRQENLDQANNKVKEAEAQLNYFKEVGATGSILLHAEEQLASAKQAQADAQKAYETAYGNFVNLLEQPHVINANIDSESVKAKIKTVLGENYVLPVKVIVGAIPGKWAGDVNGLALANGNATSKLITGASMANKTLVGELGPELAVYNGQYHLLGQNGAEFVNLPSDAIVFNHKQTEGIAKGQMGVRGTALSGGNFNWYEALEALWRQGDKSSFDSGWGQFFGNTGGKGGGKTYEFAEQEGEEWYNYLRRIAKLEQEINQLEAERENIMDGGAYLRNLREVQAVYQEQLITQKQLLEYQKAQLELERKQIQEKWGGALTFTSEGLLQYIFGNEVNGGKGILSLFEAFNKMSGAQQVAAVTGIGYSYTDQNGKKLEGEELVQKFLEELTGDIEHYNDLYDSVAETTTGLEEFKKAIKDVEDEIRDNRIELEEKIYDLVVEGWENNIEKMEEELDILSEANERYINGLNEALEKEKSLYDKNEATADREQLQRRLSLLRRSGGSASEIASLEEQLNDTLKDEYFQHQQEAIDKVAEASQTQIEKMEEQIQIQKDQLEFSKEHGLIWEDVNRILSGSTSEILEFIQGNDTTFIEKSATEIGKQLEEWSKKVGIFTEDRQTQEYTKEAIKNFNADTLNSSAFNKASADQKKAYTDMFASYFTNARMDGKSTDEAYAHAYTELRKILGEGGEGSNIGNGSGTGNAKDTETPKQVERWKFTFNGTEIKGYTTEAGAESRIEQEYKKLLKEYLLTGKEKNGDAGFDRLMKVNAIKAAALKSITPYKSYSHGGIVDYTGLAMVHGSKSRPEGFLNAEQTAQITEALRSNGKNSVLSEVRQAVSEIAAAAKALVMNETNNSSSINVAPGAVVVKVEKLNDKYDINSVADDIMNKMVSIASKATNRGVNRR